MLVLRTQKQRRTRSDTVLDCLIKNSTETTLTPHHQWDLGLGVECSGGIQAVLVDERKVLAC